MAARRKTIPPEDPVIYLWRTPDRRIFAASAWGPDTDRAEGESRAAVAKSTGVHPRRLVLLAAATGPTDILDLAQRTRNAESWTAEEARRAWARDHYGRKRREG